MKKPKAKSPPTPKTKREWALWNAGRLQGFELGRRTGEESLARRLRELLQVKDESLPLVEAVDDYY